MKFLKVFESAEKVMVLFENNFYISCIILTFLTVHEKDFL